MSPQPRALLVIAVALWAAACRCDRPNTQTRIGELNFVFDQGGSTVTSATGEYEFGKVAMGVKKTLKVTVQNRGDGALDLLAFEKVEGAAVTLGSAEVERPVFKLDYSPLRIAPGSSAEFEATFDAPVDTDPSVRTKDHSVRLLAKAANSQNETAELTLRGTAVSGQCNLPDLIDFGAVAITDSFKQGFTIQNVSPLPATLRVGAVTSSSGDDRNFTFAPESAQGNVPLESGFKRDVVLAFRPTEPKDYFAVVKVRAAEQCPDVAVKLMGTGVAQTLGCAPAPLQLGYVSPGLRTQGELTLTNSSFVPANLSQMAARAGTAISRDFRLLGPDALTVPAATRVTDPDGSRRLVSGKVTVQVVFEPTLLGPRQANLTGVTSTPAQPMLQCPLSGAGGGPDIDVLPRAGLNFGRVPYFASAPKAFFVQRKITVQNVGTLPNPPDPAANLVLGTKDGQGDRRAPYWRVVPKNAATLESELCVGEYDENTFPTQPCRNTLPLNGPGRYDPSIGVVAATGQSTLDISIRVTPAAANKSLEWDLVLLSNDPDEPEVTVNIKAQSVVLPPCQFQVTPLNLNFGLVTPPTYRDLSFAITNLGTQPSEVCLITWLDLKLGSDPLYTLPGGPIDQYEMAAGETVNVLVRSAPTGSVGSTVRTALGAVQVGISSPITPQREVSLSTSVATSCLTIAPDDLDFGTVEKDCSSNLRVFSVYNTCSTPVTVNSWSMVAPAGVAAGSTPSCPGPASCPEFLLDGTPSFSMGTQLQPGSSMPATFTLRYHPLNFGPDTGAFLLKVTQNGQVVDYIVTLRGRGDGVGRNVDTFVQDARPKADILLVIDNSCSMADKQTALSQNFASFISYATRTNVDYQIGVITTDLGSSTEGELIGDPMGMLGRILKPSTPNIEAQFTARVKVGISGGTEGMAEPAIKALTAPLITSVNAGFLRSDAVLAVVIISDAGDQSPLAATIYETQLRNIKGVQRPAQFSYNNVGPFGAPTPTCMYDDFTDVSKNLHLVQRLNGAKDEICTPSWSTTLEEIGKTAFGYRTNFYLTAEPDLSMGHTLTVRINGVVVAATDPRGATVWSYDAMSNSVHFEPLFVPEPGKTLTVEYVVSCH